jgi:branched-subunit amino acid transport protein
MTIWMVILGLVLTTVAVKGLGPVLFGGRDLPAAFSRVIVCIAPALLAALVLTAAVGDGQRLALGAHTVGVAAGGVLLWRRQSLILSVLVAVAVTAGIRAIW